MLIQAGIEPAMADRWLEEARVQGPPLTERPRVRNSIDFLRSVRRVAMSSSTRWTTDSLTRQRRGAPLKEQGTTTVIVHSDRLLGVEHGAVRKPIHSSTQYGHERVEDLIGVFQGTVKNAFNYARQGTPTTAALEAKLTRLEQGRGTVCFASGMAALAATFLTLLKAWRSFRCRANSCSATRTASLERWKTSELPRAR